MPANLNDAAHILLGDAAIFTGEHLRDNILAHIIFILIGDDHVAEALNRYFLGLLLVEVFPVPINHRAELNCSREGQILIKGSVRAHFEDG